MQDIEIHTTKRGVIIGAIVFCFLTIAILLSIGALLFPSDPHAPRGGALIVTGFFIFFDFLVLAIMDGSQRSISLHGTQLTVRDGKILKGESTIDLTRLSQIEAGFGSVRNWGNTMLRAPYLALRTTDGGHLRILLNFFKREDMMRMLPLITDIVQRPDVQKRGPVKKVLFIWYRSQAPEPVGVEKDKFFGILN